MREKGENHMRFDNILLIAALQIAVFLFGYAFGRRVGKKEGIAEGMSLLPLEWRKKLNETGICPMCGLQLNQSRNCDNIHSRD